MLITCELDLETRRICWWYNSGWY